MIIALKPDEVLREMYSTSALRVRYPQITSSKLQTYQILHPKPQITISCAWPLKMI
jgi:hypothetical protein